MVTRIEGVFYDPNIPIGQKQGVTIITIDEYYKISEKVKKFIVLGGAILISRLI